jgi:outer membrane biosynthesis protein TonB
VDKHGLKQKAWPIAVNKKPVVTVEATPSSSPAKPIVTVEATPSSSPAILTWKTQVVALLERNKRYPEGSQSRGEQGIARVFFSLDRQGSLIESC